MEIKWFGIAMLCCSTILAAIFAIVVTLVFELPPAVAFVNGLFIGAYAAFISMKLWPLR